VPVGAGAVPVGAGAVPVGAGAVAIIGSDITILQKIYFKTAISHNSLIS
jgi:hypothetical protein